MAKFIFSMGNENYRKLQLEAKTRDVTIQALSADTNRGHTRVD